jgi:DNA-binding transcriptional ArsR family regulator
MKLTDPRALRAVAHPLRLRLLGLLRRDGPLTATQAAAHVGESPAATSFHLRQLAKHGLIEEAGGGRGRERPWRATALFTSWPAAPENPELAAATGLLSTVIAERYFAQLTAWLDRRSSEPPEWQASELFGDVAVHLTPDELGELDRSIQQLIEPYLERIANPGLRPDGSRPVKFIALGFPLDEADT